MFTIPERWRVTEAVSGGRGTRGRCAIWSQTRSKSSRSRAIVKGALRSMGDRTACSPRCNLQYCPIACNRRDTLRRIRSTVDQMCPSGSLQGSCTLPEGVNSVVTGGQKGEIWGRSCGHLFMVDRNTGRHWAGTAMNGCAAPACTTLVCHEAPRCRSPQSRGLCKTG